MCSENFHLFFLVDSHRISSKQYIQRRFQVISPENGSSGESMLESTVNVAHPKFLLTLSVDRTGSASFPPPSLRSKRLFRDLRGEDAPPSSLSSSSSALPASAWAGCSTTRGIFFAVAPSSLYLIAVDNIQPKDSERRL